jgi:protocatechuate 3,4-dioxygenase beta subunit
MHVEDYRFVTETDTDADGRFAFSGLPRSGYLVIVTAPGKGTLTTKVETPATDLVLELTDAARLEVLATNGEGEAAAGVVVHVEQPDGWRFWNAETDDNGLAVFADLPAQRVSVVALPTIRPGPLHRYDIPAAEVALTAGQQRRLRIQVVDRVSVRLAVTDRQGQRHEGVVLGFRSRGRGPVGAIAGAGEWKRLEALRVTTDATGEATADLFPGEYSVMLAKGATPVRLVRCTIDADAANRLELVVPRESTVLRGRVRDHVTGTPVRGLMVSVREKGDTWAVADVRTDAEGRFELIGLPSGPLSVNCLSTGIRGPKLYTGAQVDFSDRNRIELDLYVVPPDTKKNCRVAVTVRDADGAALADAYVMVSAKLGDGTVIAGRARTDEQGLVVVRTIEADGYRLFVRAKGTEPVIRFVPRTGDLTEATIELGE